MKKTKYIPLALLCITIFTSGLYAQTEEAQILAIRNLSNTALKAYDNDEVLSYLTDDVLTTTGNGTLLCGKKELENYIQEGGKSKMYWIRNTTEVLVNSNRGLAWESGTWNGYDPEKGEGAIVGGHYAAIWTKASGVWKIKSQLFVTLNEN